jgi:hypothetical protein
MRWIILRSPAVWGVVRRVTIVVAASLAVIGLGTAAASGPSGTYTGTYTCRQGATGLSLSITAAPGDKLSALFHFYGLPSNPSFPEGCFLMRGTYDSASESVRLYGGEWLLRPPNFRSVDLQGQLSGGVLTGTVVGPSCTSFSVRSDARPPPLPTACSGE